MVKTCKGCHCEYPLENFTKDKKRPNGRGSHCHTCQNAINRLNYYKNHEARKVYFRAKKNAWNAANPERVKAHSLRTRTKHKEVIAARRKVREKRPEVIEHKRAYMTAYRANNRQKMIQLQRLYKARREGASGVCTIEQLNARIDYYGGLCWICSVAYEAIDHVKPVTKGGTNWPANLRPICISCNSQKRNKWPFVPTLTTN